MSLGRILVIASNVFREVIRDRVLYLIAFFGVAMVVAAVLLPYVAASTENQMLLDLGLATISVLGLVIAVFVGTGLVNKEIEKRTVHVLIAKPISHADFIIGKHLGLSAVLVVLVGAMTAIYMAVLTLWEVPFPVGSILVSVLFQCLELSLITAVAILFGVFTSSLLATLFTVGIYLMGHFSRDLLSLGNLSESPTLKSVTQGMYLILPDLSRLNLKNEAVYGLQILPQPVELATSAAYGVIYIALVLAIAILIFSRRQF